MRVTLANSTLVCVEGIHCNLLFWVVLLSVCMVPVIND